MPKFLTVRDSGYVNGMNTVDDQKALKDGECVELMNAYPGYPVVPRKGCRVIETADDSSYNNTIGAVVFEQLPYVNDSFERGIRWTFGLNFPNNLQEVNWSFLNINGLGFRLDQPVKKRHNDRVVIDYYLKLETEE